MAFSDSEFDRLGYVILRNVLPPTTRQVLLHYALSYAKSEGATRDRFVPGAPAGYGHRLMELLLQQMLPAAERASGRSLFPTYSYFRVYQRGDTLPRHRDRPACEISVSLSLGYLGATEWALMLHAREGPVTAAMRAGDGVVYKGTELEHWREPFSGDSAAQVFLHYVDQKGPFAEWRFDKRTALGAPPVRDAVGSK